MMKAPQIDDSIWGVFYGKININLTRVVGA